MTRRYLVIAALVCLGLASLSEWVYVLAGCGDTWQPDGADTFGGTCGSAGQITTLTKTKHWRIFWTDGYERRDAQVQEQGDCKAGFFTNTECYPVFHTPYWAVTPSTSGTFTQQAQRSGYNDVEDDGTCIVENTFRFHTHRHACSIAGSGSGCTTPGFDGSCPYGTYPNGSGMCCPRAGRARVSRLSASTASTST